MYIYKVCILYYKCHNNTYRNLFGEIPLNPMNSMDKSIKKQWTSHDVGHGHGGTGRV